MSEDAARRWWASCVEEGRKLGIPPDAVAYRELVALRKQVENARRDPAAPPKARRKAAR